MKRERRKEKEEERYGNYDFVWLAMIWYGKVWIIGILDFYMDFY